jgi:hypothetical protein
VNSSNVAFHSRWGAGGPPSTGRSPNHTWAPSPPPRALPHREAMKTHADPTKPPCLGRLQLALGSCGVTDELARSVPMPQHQRPSHLGVRIAKDLTALCQLEHLNHHHRQHRPASLHLGPSANIGIWAVMGLTLSRGPAHGHAVDRRYPSAQETSAAISLTLPFAAEFPKTVELVLE